MVWIGQTISLPQTQPLLTYDQLRAEFGRLLMRVRRILSNSPKQEDNLEACKEFCKYLKVSSSAKVSLFSSEKLKEISNCKDFEQLFIIVNDHLSWDEPYILTEIIDECDSDEAEQEFNKYKRKMAVSKALEIIASIKSDPPPPGFEKFHVVVDKPYKQLTIEKYEEIKSFIFDNLDVRRFVTTGYIGVLFDSLHLEWHVTMEATSYMIKMAHERKSLFETNFIVLMQIGKEVIIDTHTKQTSAVSLNNYHES